MQPAVRLTLADRNGRLAGVRLVPEFDLGAPADFVRSGGRWHLDLAQPPVDRIEYLLEFTDHNARRWTSPDPGNPRQAPGAFGPKSVLEFAGYRPPAWLDAGRGEPGSTTAFEFAAPGLDDPVGGELWAAAELGDGQPAPLLIVHDGPEYARLGDLTTYLETGVAAGTLPPLRAALLGPADRNGWYSANPRYTAALAEHVLPGLPPATVRVGVGVSLGALAMLHAHQRIGLDGLLLQSGSFFTPRFDPQERGFAGFAAVTAFVARLHTAARDPHPVPAVLTCGGVEENLTNNLAMAAALRRLGYATEFVRVRDAHNFVAWRDALHPHLTDLITGLVARHAA